MVAERQTNIQTYMHTLFRKQFQETRCAPIAGLWPAVGANLVLKCYNSTIGILIQLEFGTNLSSAKANICTNSSANPIEGFTPKAKWNHLSHLQGKPLTEIR